MVTMNKQNGEIMILSLDEEKILYKGIYKFYVNEKILRELENNLINKKINDKCLETTIYNDEIYYCVYIGKTLSTKGFAGRVMNRYLTRGASTTLKTSLMSALKINKDEVMDLLNDKKKCFFMILPVYNSDSKTINSLEKKMINSCCHILNINDNEKEDAKNKLKEERKETKNKLKD